ncbi:uncharacterized protein BP01DRAFT_41555 [Aspergillus saccharolyticus JOP 1030-1]|uniref:Uncharacterized protein n=1 Tax=Aspergillus saccharolyticus JOP 1030-1 TaxID=1450539 RepID=A0A318ZZG3_9EURO|nr:hypothetical protein BP01DRAFT_41555 [Aspergillus saccharolyticus JOP 1030-1]PYH45478.1 hypothetical protein BP01DRAFT_41555 [Aspergillus saccharolyticus JOP 1030-1]
MMGVLLYDACCAWHSYSCGHGFWLAILHLALIIVATFSQSAPLYSQFCSCPDH